MSGSWRRAHRRSTGAPPASEGRLCSSVKCCFQTANISVLLPPSVSGQENTYVRKRYGSPLIAAPPRRRASPNYLLSADARHPLASFVFLTCRRLFVVSVRTRSRAVSLFQALQVPGSSGARTFHTPRSNRWGDLES